MHIVKTKLVRTKLSNWMRETLSSTRCIFIIPTVVHQSVHIIPKTKPGMYLFLDFRSSPRRIFPFIFKREPVQKLRIHVIDRSHKVNCVIPIEMDSRYIASVPHVPCVEPRLCIHNRNPFRLSNHVFTNPEGSNINLSLPQGMEFIEKHIIS